MSNYSNIGEPRYRMTLMYRLDTCAEQWAQFSKNALTSHRLTAPFFLLLPGLWREQTCGHAPPGKGLARHEVLEKGKF